MSQAAAGGAVGRMVPRPGYVSKTDMVAALIREQIITGELPAGEQLRQRDLAARFQVSQTPVREAMRRLESEGLVIGDTHRGFTVAGPDEGPAEENFQIRAALESLGASLAARKIDAAGITRLQALNDQIRALAEDSPRYADLNREFHFSLYEYARSPLLLSLMRLLWASLHGGPQVTRSHAESARQHDVILAALRAGDPAAAAEGTYQHIMGTERGR
jgi:DNA-binding GntR family transcriptional regulator